LLLNFFQKLLLNSIIIDFFFFYFKKIFIYNRKQKRENHNALERKRRIYQKSKLEELKIRLPPLSSKKPSTITIMCKAIGNEYIYI